MDWTASMQQTFEYYIVDPGTWQDSEIIRTVKSCTISRDSEAETLGSASFEITESVGECYIRVYLVATQKGVTEKYPLGTFLVQTPSSSFDGKVRAVSMDAYTPLLELKEKLPPIGYSILKGQNILSIACDLAVENMRAPVVDTSSSDKLDCDFVADINESWLSFISALVANADYTLDLDELGRVLFSPNQDAALLRPVWTYNDNNSSILYPEFTMDHDLFNVPNVVEVVYSSSNGQYCATATNNDRNSPTSIYNRGRQIMRRITDPDLGAEATRTQVKDYAKRVLKQLSSVEYTVSYTHGYCPVRLGDCVRLNYERAGITDIKAKVISQSIKCEQGCPVTEKAVFTTNLWG